MQQYIEQVIAENGVTPEAMLHPEGRVKERIILLRGARFQPDAA
jgi:hypothetical protein